MRAVVGTVIILPAVIISIPFVLPAAIVSVTLSKRKFWRLRAGDVIALSGCTSFVVLHAPERSSEFHIIETRFDNCFLRIWTNANDAYTYMFNMGPCSTFVELIDPLRYKGRMPVYKVAEMLAAIDNAYFRHDVVSRGVYRSMGEDERRWVRCTLFELMRPVRVIQRAWRAHYEMRRKAAARVISDAALHFLYRPKGVGYNAALRRWHDHVQTEPER